MAKILVAEDDKLISSSLCDALKVFGHEPTPVYDGESAVTTAKEMHPDLMLLDVMMPNLDGISVLWELKADPAMAHVPIIVLTNIADTAVISKIIEAGATDYLLKSDQSIEQIAAKANDVLKREIRM